ncbi:hypothetical protein M8R19_12360 [Pseudomonas sp. R3.Fl]|uniref:hypothetical protein n=1 Tax=Pseudomonas sp. R3.Fl TaxID=2928708 RepID=UPI00201E34CB|nr:hypothetical protein [Pseudomonas sp. R3.Fl]MCL6689503.1 hypothetical protein [Pseudomonas sp. R3.Fl]
MLANRFGTGSVREQARSYEEHGKTANALQVDMKKPGIPKRECRAFSDLSDA